MQTNAPATGEWVDQYNRAIAFGQIGGATGAPLPTHASTHASDGADPITPASIGAVTLATNNILTAPRQAILRANNVDLLAAVGTRTLLYTVPAGFTYTTTSIKVIITSTNQSVAFTTAPEFAVTNGSLQDTANDLALSTARVHAVGDVILLVNGYGSASASRKTATDTVGFSVVSPARVGGTQTVMLATVIILGELYPQ
jgi:hypothetical protein